MRFFLKDATPNRCAFLAPVIFPYDNYRGWEYAYEVREVSSSPGWEDSDIAALLSQVSVYLESPVEQIQKGEALELVRSFESVRTCTCQRCLEEFDGFGSYPSKVVLN